MSIKALGAIVTVRAFEIPENLINHLERRRKTGNLFFFKDIKLYLHIFIKSVDRAKSNIYMGKVQRILLIQLDLVKSLKMPHR